MAEQMQGARAPHVRTQGGRRREQARLELLLSGYVDGRLSPAERAQMDRRLAVDGGLRAELAALRRTVALVRNLSAAPLPRNFILPAPAAARPAQHSRSRLARAAPWLTAASAAVAGLMVVVVAGQLLLSGLAVSPAMMAPVAPEPEVAVQGAVQKELLVAATEEVALMAAEEAPSAELMLAEEPPSAEALDVAGETEAPAGAPAEASAPAPAAETAPPPSATDAGPSGAGMVEESPAAKAASDEGLATDQPLAASAPVEVTGEPESQVLTQLEAELGEGAAPEGARQVQPAEPAPEGGEHAALGAAQPVILGGRDVSQPLLVLEIALGLALIGLVAVMVLAWRERSRRS